MSSHDSPVAQAGQRLAAVADASSRTERLRPASGFSPAAGAALQARIDQSPAIAAQRKAIASAFGQRPGRKQPPVQAAPAASASSAPVQRRIGFEFETGWLLKAPANAIGMHTAVIEGAHWKVVPDRVDYTEEQLAGMGIGVGRTHVGSGSIEFVTDAFEETDVAAGGGLDTAMAQIEQVCNALNNASRGLFGGALDTPLNQVVGKNGVSWGSSLHLPGHAPGGTLGDDAHRTAVARAYAKRDNILVRRIGALGCAPQMTGGIKLDRLSHLLDRMSQAPGAAAPAGQYAPGSALLANSDPVEVTIVANCVARAQTVGAARVADASIVAGNQAAYEGALAEMGSYVRLAAAYGNNIAYDKGIAPLLSRTNFGQLPAWLLGVAGFVDDVLYVSGRYPGANSAAMAGAGTTKLFTKVGLHDGVTARGWLGAISLGNDPLSWGQDRTNANWNPQQVGTAPNQALGHVFEFRRMVNPLAFNEWRAYALGMAQLVVLANQGNLQ